MQLLLRSPCSEGVFSLPGTLLFAFCWMREEPHENHIAMPWQLLLASIATALVWGWPRVAGILALTWGGLLRIGEAFAAKRSDLLLPGDVHGACDYALLSVGEPKTQSCEASICQD